MLINNNRKLMNGREINNESNLKNNEDIIRNKLQFFFEKKYNLEKIGSKYYEDLKSLNKLSTLQKVLENRFHQIEEISHQKCFKCRFKLLQELDNRSNTPDKISNFHEHYHSNLTDENIRSKTPEIQINKKRKIKKTHDKNKEHSFFQVNTFSGNNTNNNKSNNKIHDDIKNKKENLKINTENTYKKVFTTMEKSPNKLKKINNNLLYKNKTINNKERAITPTLEIKKKKRLIKNEFDMIQNNKKNKSYVELAYKKKIHKTNKSEDNINKNGIIGTIDKIKSTVNGINQSLNLIENINNTVKRKRSNSYLEKSVDNKKEKKVVNSINNNKINDIQNQNIGHQKNYLTERIDYKINPTKNSHFKITSEINNSNKPKNISSINLYSKKDYIKEKNRENNNQGYSKLSLKVKRIKENYKINEYRIEKDFKNKKEKNNDKIDNEKNKKYDDYINLISNSEKNNIFNVDSLENINRKVSNEIKLNQMKNQNIMNEKIENKINNNNEIIGKDKNKLLQNEQIKQIKKEEKKNKYIECFICLLKSGFLLPKKSFYLTTYSNQILSKFPLKELIKNTILNLENNYNKLNIYISKYNINQFEEPLKFNEKSIEKLNLISQNDEINLCSKSQPFIIINLFTILYIILDENYLEIPTKTLIINLYQTIFPKFKIKSISKNIYLNIKKKIYF